MFDFFREHIIWTGAGATVLIFIFFKLFPKEKIEKFGFVIADKIFAFLYDIVPIGINKFGKMISLGGRSKLGAKMWEKIESEIIQATIDSIIAGIMKAWTARIQHTCVLNHWWISLREGWGYDNEKKYNNKENKEIPK